MSVELLHHVRLIDPTSGTDRIVDVLFDQGKVRSIEPHIMPPSDATIIEGQGKILGPGLVQNSNKNYNSLDTHKIYNS